jgi:diguanylate cyclase (GGDEF)-like protein/PAS domain S-box-containing protein
MIALNLGSGLLAGMVQVGAAGQGLVGVAIVGVGTLAVLLLLSVSMARIEAAHQAQESRIQSAQREAELNHRRFVAAFANAAVGMAIVDAQGAIVRANLALCGLLRRSEEELHGAHFSALIHPEDRTVFERHAQAQRAATTSTRATPLELRCKANGELLWVELHRARFYQAEDDRDGLIYQLLDVTSRRVAEQRLQHIAYHDSLTDLANRASFHERVSAAVEQSRLMPEAQFAVVFLDLDRFKVVNDSLGHLAGNELLREVARRLGKCVRTGDMVARLGGDEFAVLLNHMHDKASTVQLAEALLAELVHPVSIRGHEIVPQASAGITFSDLGYRTVDELLRDADLAMYEAKAGGRGRLAVYDRSMHERMSDKLALEADLRHAIGEGELSLAFQPLYALADGELVGFEALARWMHPTRGPVSPAVFIALAEESGHIEALTHWALNTALTHLTEWQSAAPELPHLGVSVNISGRDMARPRFVDNVLDTLRRHGVAPHLLTLEITETVLMEHFDEAAEALGRLHAIGVRLAIDDFGTGYSSLSYLSKLPIDCLKIDRSFVQAMNIGADGVEIIRAVANLGRALRKKVVAEGIETEAQLATLRQLDVDVGQGYLLSRPVAPQLVGKLLSQRRLSTAA